MTDIPIKLYSRSIILNFQYTSRSITACAVIHVKSRQVTFDKNCDHLFLTFNQFGDCGLLLYVGPPISMHNSFSVLVSHQ